MPYGSATGRLAALRQTNSEKARENCRSGSVQSEKQWSHTDTLTRQCRFFVALEGMRSSLRLSKVSETPKILKMEKVLKVQLAAISMKYAISAMDGNSSSTTNLTCRASSGSILKRLKPSFMEWLRWLLRLLFVLTVWNPVQWLKGIETYWNHLGKNTLAV